jgi:hypothetical protein
MDSRSYPIQSSPHPRDLPKECGSPFGSQRAEQGQIGVKTLICNVFLSKIEHVFTVPTRGCVIVPVALTEQSVSIGDLVQLRSPERNLEARIVGIQMITQISGPCRVGFLLSTEINKSLIPQEAEIWIGKQPSATKA